VSRGVHTLQDGRPGLAGVVNTALANVIAADEEGCLDTVLIKHVKDSSGESVRSIVESECNGARGDTGCNDCA